MKEVSVDDLAERLHKYQCSIKESPESNNIIGGKQELRILMNKKKGILAQLEAANAVSKSGFFFSYFYYLIFVKF